MKGGIITDTKEKITDEAVKQSNVKLIPKGTTLLSFKLSIGKTAIAGANLYTNEAIAGLIPKDDKTLDSYLYQLFTAKLIDLENIGFKAFGKSLNSAFLRDDVKIPRPPVSIQAQIVAECEGVDVERAKYLKPGMSSKEFEVLIKSIKAEVMNKYLAPEQEDNSDITDAE